MIDLRRRTLIKGAAATAALAAAPAFARAHASTRPALIVYDRRFPASFEMAREWMRQGVVAIDPRASDLGVAWRERIPRLLDEHRAPVRGMTMWSDRFICEAFGRERGMRLQVFDRRSGPNAPDGELLEWILA